MDKHLHIICFTVPYPPDYGGVTDLFYKLPALQAQGVRIHLHCFDYGRGRQPALAQFCETVNYYSRFIGSISITNRLPYIVSSRHNEALSYTLFQDEHPILMEGIHCTWLLNDRQFGHRRCFVRLHNVEYKYYEALYRNSLLSFKKLYYWFESRLLKSYERRIANKAVFLAVTQNDAAIYRKEMHSREVCHLPVFIPGWEMNVQEGIGSYCLYHGDLSIEVNEKAVIWLLRKVFGKLQVPLVIAGKDPSEKLKKLISAHPKASLVINPSEEAMRQLIGNAQVHLIPSYTDTGIKLKLLNALFNGRHCVVTPQTVEDTGLEPLCHIASSANAFSAIILQLYRLPFGRKEIALRKNILQGMFDNEKNAKELVRRIWG